MKLNTQCYIMTKPSLIRSVGTVALILCCFSMGSLSANWLVYDFPGNNYFDFSYISTYIWLLLCFIVLNYKLNLNFISQDATVEYCIYILFVAIVLFSTNAVQYTPFAPIDNHIIALEQRLHLNVLACVIWLHQHVDLRQSLGCVYEVIGIELLALPIMAIFLKKYYYLYEYYFLMLVTTLFGFVFYYFFPTTGPASMFHFPYFTGDQLATGLKFQEIHHYQQPSTIAGGMIAMPSFHVIWACLTAYLVRFQPVLCSILIVVNLIIILSCVLLGWHYFLDVIGSFLTVSIAIGIKKRLFSDTSID